MSFHSSEWDSDTLGDRMHRDIFKKKKRTKQEKIKPTSEQKIIKHIKLKDMTQKVKQSKAKFCDKIIKKNNMTSSKKKLKRGIITSLKKMTEKEKVIPRKIGKNKFQQCQSVSKKDSTETVKTRKKSKRSETTIMSSSKPQNKTASKQETAKVAGLNIANLKKQLANSLQAGPSSLRERMLDKLNAARFRFLNEQLYTSEGAQARKLFQEDPEAFQTYHQGYRQQVKRWPLNPLDTVIAAIRRLPDDRTVADFGCGDARLARSVPQQVHSFDLVASAEGVVACDMARVPLSAGAVDVVVFCLSLMGTNLADFLLEANRVLALGGMLKIVDVESRFQQLPPPAFVRALQAFGFDDAGHDLSHDLFFFFDFTKGRHVKPHKRLPTIALLPCIYKKR